MKILYVEDNPNDADLAQRRLRKHAPQFALEVVSTQSEAVARLSGPDTPPFDLVLTDLRLPDGGGLSLLTYIRERGLPIAVVVITGTGDEKTAITALKAGADDYVSKRDDYLERLPLTLENALRRRRAQAVRQSRRLKALYAEHHGADIDLTLRHLQRYAPHIQFEVVRTGAEALQRLPQAREASRYDVILLDYRLPGLNALEVLKELRQDRGLDIPVVLVTGQGDEEVALQALKLGAEGYLVKNPGYLHQLPGELENACYRAEIIREQAALKQSEERLRLAQRAARIGTWDWNLVTGESNWSEGIYELLGHAQGDGRANVEDFVGSIHPEDRERAKDKVESVIRYGEEYYDEFRIIRPDGAIAWLASKGRVIRGVSGSAERMIGVNFDITDRKRAEERLRSYFELPLIGMAITSPDRRFVEVNQKLCDILGYSMDHLTGMSWVDVTHPDDVAENIRLLDETLRGKTEGYAMDKRFIHRDGHIVYASISARCARRADRTVDYLALIVQDITQRKQAEDRLMESEAQLRLLTELIPQHIWTGFPGNIADYRNQRWLDYTGMTIEDVRQKGWMTALHPDDHERVVNEIRDASSQKGIYEVEIRLKGVDGRYRWFLARALPQLDQEGNIIKWYGTNTDIEDRKRAEESLRESEARFRNMADNAPVTVWMSEPDGSCSYVSQSWYEFTGQTPEAALGFGWAAALHPDDREFPEKTFLAANEKREAFRLEYRLRRSDGEYRWVIDSARPRFSSQGEFLGYIGSVVDITETKRAELNTQFINQLDFELSQIADADEIIRLATSRLGEYLGVASCYVIEVNPAAGLAFVRESWDGWRNAGPSKVGEYRISDFVTPECLDEFEAGRATVVKDVMNDPRIRDFAPKYKSLGVGAFISIPALNDRQWEANLVVDHPQARDWRPDETQLMRDITARLWPAYKRARAAEALRESEQRFRQLAENIGAVFFITQGFSATPPGQILYVSPAYEKIWGRSCESLYQDTRSWLEALHPEDNERVLASMRGVGRAHFDEEFRIIRPDGEVRWVHDRVFPIRDERGEIYRLAGIVEDITERKQFEEALRESEERYRSVVESQTDLICRYLPDTTLTFVNAPYCRYFDKSQEELIGTKFLDFIPESAREVARKHIESLVESPRVEIDEHQVLLPDGSIGWQQWVDHAILDASGKIVEFQAVGRDITERKQIEEERREGEERLRLALEAGRMGVWERDTRTNAVKWSKESFTIMGLPPFGITLDYHIWADRVHPDDLPVVTEKMRKAIEEKGDFRHEYRIIWPDGSLHWVEGHGKPVYDEDGQCLKVSGLIVDISERKRNYLRLNTQYAISQILSEAASVADASPRLLQVICESLGWEFGEIWLVDREAWRLTFLENWSQPSRELGEFASASRQFTFPPGVGLPGRVWKSRQPVWITDVADSNFPRASLAQRAGLHNGFGFPALVGDETLGVMVFFSRDAREPDEDLLRMMASIGSQIGQFAERKQAEEALRESEERLRLALEAGRMGVWEWDMETDGLKWSKEHYTIMGLEPFSIEPKSYGAWADRVHPDDLPVATRAMRRAIQEKGEYCCEYRVIWPDGSVRWVEGRGKPIYDEGGQCLKVSGLIVDITQRKQAEEALRESEEALRESYTRIEDLAGRLIVAQEEERRHIARELHDDLNQQVAALAIGISRLKRQFPDAGAAVREQIAKLRNKTDMLSERIRQVSHELHSSVLQHVGLPAALNSYCAEFSEREGIAVALDIGDGVEGVPPEAALCLYRVAQESLRNVARHSGARRAVVTLARANGAVELRVADQGVGFDPGQAHECRGLGLVSMEERVKLLHGRFVLTTGPGAGTELRAQIPLRGDHEQTTGIVG